jgi:predicted ABC-type sugar transport system permease subunit
MSAGAETRATPPSMIGERGRWRLWLSRNDVFVILVGFALLASVISPAFLTANNLGNLLSQSALLGLLAIAQFLVVVSGGFDLSVAAVMASASCRRRCSPSLPAAPAACSTASSSPGVACSRLSPRWQ